MLSLNYKSFGAGDPIIILHGLFGTLDNWQTMARKLSEHFLVYIVDQRNHGRSPHADRIDYSLMAEDLRDFMESNWIFNAHIIGHSMGGKTAMRFALDNPGMVDKLVVVDIAPKAYSGGHETIFRAMLNLDLKALQNRQQAEEALRQEIPEQAVRQFLLKNLTREKSGGFRWKMNLPALHAAYPDILQGIEATSPFSKQALFVSGGLSNYIRQEDEAVILQLFPEAVIHTIPGAGHWVHAEAPEPFLEVIKGFIM